MNNMNFDLNYIRKCSSMIKEFPVYTEAEKKQVDEGRTCIKLSKGQPIYIRVISRNVEILSLALIIPRLILGTSVLMIFIYLPTLGSRLLWLLSSTLIEL